MENLLSVEILGWFLISIIWLGLGLLLLFVLFSIPNTPVQKAKGLEFFNPFWLIDNYKINVFGAMVLLIVHVLLCPHLAIMYWLYKACKIGVKSKNTEN